jgi:photosystem II stability/assembly factor-like uncharacterized protein
MKKLLIYSFIVFTTAFFISADFNDGPQIWTQSLSNAGQIWGLALSAVSNPNVIYAASNSTGVWKTTNAGLNWFQTNSGLSNLVLQCIAVCRSNSNVVMCGTTNSGTNPGVYRSTDGGANWVRVVNGITETNINIQSVAIDPQNPNIAYITVFDGTTNSVNGIYKTTDGGALWTPITNGIGTIKNFLCITINPLNPNVLYAGTSFDPITSSGPAKVYKSVNGGALWSDISNGLPSQTTDVKPIRQISIYPIDTSLLLLGQFVNTDTLSGGMYVSTNGGALWQRRNSGLPMAVGMLPRSCLIHPNAGSEMYVGLGNSTNTNIGIYRSTNYGITWQEFNNGAMLNTYTVRALEFRVSAFTVYAGAAHPTLTSGQGVFEYTFILNPVNDPASEIPKHFHLYQNYPNPFNPVTKFEFTIPKSTFVKLSVFDITGKLVSEILNTQLNAGNYKIDFNAAHLSSGTYFYTLEADGFRDTKKMMIVK